MFNIKFFVRLRVTFKKFEENANKLLSIDIFRKFVGNLFEAIKKYDHFMLVKSRQFSDMKEFF